MYGTSEVKGDVGRPGYLAGITENVELTKVAYENSKQDGTGKNVLTFTFTAPNNSQFRKIFWDIDPAQTAKLNQAKPRVHSRNNEKLGYEKGKVITDEQAIQIAYSDFNRNIKHILTKYMSEEDAIIKNVNSYEEFSKQVIKKLTGKYEGKKMRLKTVFNKNGYVDFPRFGNYIEPMSVETSSITWDDRYDVKTRNTPSSEEEIEESFSETAEATNDLPF